jgi:hypothetical protein
MGRKMDRMSSIIAYENGELEEEEVILLFQDLIDSGLAWQLQGSYGRMAEKLLESGYCTEAE